MTYTQPAAHISKPRIEKVERPIDYLPSDIFDKSLAVDYAKNNFYSFLISLFGHQVSLNILEDYFIGTSKHWEGSTVFWQADISGKFRQAKVMLYDKESGRRVKGDQDYVYFAGKKILNNYDANLVQCFYGEYLLSVYPDKKVAIVESEKTAIIAGVYFPDLIWLATGGSHGCKWTQREVCSVLKDREIMLFPDLGFYDKWVAKAEEVQRVVNSEIFISDLLEREATEEQKLAGWDLADYLLLNRDPLGWAMTTEGYPLFWDIAA
jgi:hypothetical protein